MDLSIGSALSWARKEFGTTTEAAPLDESASKALFAQAQQSLQALDQATERAASESLDRGNADARKQSVFDSIYLVAAADGAISPLEKAKLVLGIQGLLGEGVDEAAVDDGLEMARVLRDSQGLAGTAQAVADTITDEFERTALLSIASTVAWLGGGVGTKEGLALQALTSAFGMQIKVLHQIMATAAIVAKR